VEWTFIHHIKKNLLEAVFIYHSYTEKSRWMNIHIPFIWRKISWKEHSFTIHMKKNLVEGTFIYHSYTENSRGRNIHINRKIPWKEYSYTEKSRGRQHNIMFLLFQCYIQEAYDTAQWLILLSRGGLGVILDCTWITVWYYIRLYLNHGLVLY
jgi:hypothetical protein